MATATSTRSKKTTATRSKKLPDLAQAVEAAQPTPEPKPEPVKEAVHEQADKAAVAAPPPKPAPTPTPAPAPVPAPTSDKPNKAVDAYRMAPEGKTYKGNKSKHPTARESGVNRFAVLIAHKGGCVESDLRHVNPRGFEYSGGGAGYVAQNVGFNIVVKDGRYQVADSTFALDDVQRETIYQLLGGDDFYERTVDFIRNNKRHTDYATFEPSKTS